MENNWRRTSVNVGGGREWTYLLPHVHVIVFFHAWFSSHSYLSRRKAPDLSRFGQDHSDVTPDVLPFPSDDLSPTVPSAVYGDEEWSDEEPSGRRPTTGRRGGRRTHRRNDQGQGWMVSKGTGRVWRVGPWWWVFFFTEPSSQRLLQNSQKVCGTPGDIVVP